MDQLEAWGQLELASVSLCYLPTLHGHNQELQKKPSPWSYVLSWPRGSVAPEKPALLMSWGWGWGAQISSDVWELRVACVLPYTEVSPTFALLKMTENPKKLSLMWIIFINIYLTRNLK